MTGLQRLLIITGRHRLFLDDLIDDHLTTWSRKILRNK